MKSKEEKIWTVLFWICISLSFISLYIACEFAKNKVTNTINKPKHVQRNYFTNDIK